MNVVVVACNAFHLGFLGAYGNSWIETPNLDRLAAEGVVFDAHFPENLTTIPTRRSWWTGRFGFTNIDESGWTPLRPDERILPDVLADQGVATALISDVPTLRDPGFGFGRGFDDVVWVRGSGYDAWRPSSPSAERVEAEPGLRLPDADDPDREMWVERWSRFLENRKALGSDHDESRGGAARVVDRALEWLDRPRDSPFLLWLDIFSPHGPWDAPAEFRDLYAAAAPEEFEKGEEGDLVEDDLPVEEVQTLIDVPAGAVGDVISDAELYRLRKTYAGAVTLLDKQLGRLFDAIRNGPRNEDTLVVFTSDQGEPLGEHGYVRRFRPWLYEELIHTPLIVRLPKGQGGGTRSPALVQTVDLFPTVLAALGVTEEESHGHDLLPIARGETTKVRDFACLGMDGEEYAIRTPEWHFILPIEADPEEPRSTELYRKPEDRWDQNNIIGENVEVAERLELALRRFVDALQHDRLTDLPPIHLGE